MEIVEFSTVTPQWVFTVGIVLGSIILLAFVLSAIYQSKTKDGSVWFFTGFLIFFVGILYLPMGVNSAKVLPDGDRERVAQEVSEVVGFEVSVEEVDLMLEEKPVRDVYYILDGDTLVVEERSNG